MSQFGNTIYLNDLQAINPTQSFIYKAGKMGVNPGQKHPQIIYLDGNINTNKIGNLSKHKITGLDGKMPIIFVGNTSYNII